ncbi:hypothetical protein JAAARDRAFT_56903 [Jaapia argillacea MUCL 33604]|uniref:Uncharacterized protein n=1 Tax=Jaapia argillacea MUCL 33604 TaxID=933084 RepID=A0A067PVS0_9AGAM|nr:hypothetical protein JAAARDRAFT_56903 [Jaapia argillacea MUCL 33604]
MPISRIFIAQVSALWASVWFLIAIAVVTALSYYYRADCIFESSSSLLVNTRTTCSIPEDISRFVLQYSSYLQSTHTIILQVIASLSLLTFHPFLLGETWALLDTARPSLRVLEGAIGLANSPRLPQGISLAWASKSLSLPIFFVTLVGLLSLASPLAVSSIYRSHTGPFDAPLYFTCGGGIGPALPTTFNSTYTRIDAGVTVGRDIIAAKSIGLLSGNATSPFGYGPFLTEDQIRQVWNIRRRDAVAYMDVDCGSSAPQRISQFPFSISSGYWAAGYGQPGYINIAGIPDEITNDPMLSSTYINATSVISPGLVETTSTVVFFAANGTIEGSQQQIQSTNPSSRIRSIDVLVCTSTVRLQICDCDIIRGFVESCVPADPNSIPNITSSTTGGFDQYLSSPTNLGIALSAVPVLMAYNRFGALPEFIPITQKLIDEGLPPLSWLTEGTSLQPFYHIPLSYITDVMFDFAMKGMIQGLLTNYGRHSTSPGSLTSVFGTSQLWLQFTIIGVAFCCALTATILSTIPAHSRRAVELDLARTLAISRDPQLDIVFGVYADRTIEIPEEVGDMKVGYGRDPRNGRWALKVGQGHDAQTRSYYSDVPGRFPQNRLSGQGVIWPTR